MRFAVLLSLAITTSNYLHADDEFVDVPVAPAIEAVEEPQEKPVEPEKNESDAPGEENTPTEKKEAKTEAVESLPAQAATDVPVAVAPAIAPITEPRESEAPKAETQAAAEQTPTASTMETAPPPSAAPLAPKAEAVTGIPGDNSNTDKAAPSPSPNQSGNRNTGNFDRGTFFEANKPATPTKITTPQETTAIPERTYPRGKFSPTLGARFVAQSFHVPAFGAFRGVRITSEPLVGSPLKQLGLSLGDVITRLDGAPVLDLYELEIHARDTRVRYLKEATDVVKVGGMYINEHHFFSDPEATRTTHSGCNKIASRLLP